MVLLAWVFEFHLISVIFHPWCRTFVSPLFLANEYGPQVLYDIHKELSKDFLLIIFVFKLDPKTMSLIRTHYSGNIIHTIHWLIRLSTFCIPTFFYHHLRPSLMLRTYSWGLISIDTSLGCAIHPSVNLSSTNFSFQNLIFWNLFEFSMEKFT
jgi:hypothetical protein